MRGQAGWAEGGDKKEIGLNGGLQCHCEVNHHLLQVICSLFSGHGKFLESVCNKNRTHHRVSKPMSCRREQARPAQRFQPSAFLFLVLSQGYSKGKIHFQVWKHFLTLLCGKKAAFSSFIFFCPSKLNFRSTHKTGKKAHWCIVLMMTLFSDILSSLWVLLLLFYSCKKIIFNDKYSVLPSAQCWRIKGNRENSISLFCLSLFLGISVQI